MTAHYLDPSAWVKRYFEEPGSDKVASIFEQAELIVCSGIGIVEVAATVARKGRFERMDPNVRAMLLNQARSDFSAFEVMAVDAPLLAAAEALAFKHSLRAGDAVHLASAAAVARRPDITRVIVVSADGELLAACLAEGLETLDPHTVP